MADYFWSARFICGSVMLALGIATLVGGLMFLPYGRASDWYFPAVGAMLCLNGVLLALALWGGILLALRHRIAPSRDPADSPAAAVQARLFAIRKTIREHS